MITITISTSNDLAPRQLEYTSGHAYPASALEAALYAFWELSPSARSWRSELLNDGICNFDYHGIEFFRVTRITPFKFFVEKV